MVGYECDYCDREANGGCYGFHACVEHLDFAARDGRQAFEDEQRCEGHPAGPFDPMGETVYCDGSCRSVKQPA